MFNPYQQYQQNYQQFSMPAYQQKQEIIKVHGQEGANAYQLTPNSSVLLLDDTSPIVWLKQSDGAGYCTVTPYTITPYTKEPEVNIKSLEERIEALEKKLNESNIADVKRSESNK